MKRALLAFILSLVFVGHASTALAHLFEVSSFRGHGPIPARTQNPLYLLFVTDWPDTTNTAPKKHWGLDLEVAFSNIFERHPQANGIGIDLDMELVRTAINVRYGLSKTREFGLQLPFVSLFNGFLDPFIQGYHDFFGLPNAGRDQVGNNRYRYEITRNGASLFRVDEEPLGPADLMIWYKWRFVEENKFFPALAFRTLLKLPTGLPAQGTGSGRPDGGLTLIAEKNLKRVHVYSQMGLMFLGGHAELDPILHPLAVSFAQTIEFNLFEYVSLVAQLNGSSPIFKGTTIHDLAEPLLDLVVGFTGEIPLNRRHHRLYFRGGFSEDPLSIGPSVDFSVFANVGLTY